MGFRKERWINTHSVYQVSVIDALMQGVMEGVIPVKELLRRGDFGIGTFEGLGGELIVSITRRITAGKTARWRKSLPMRWSLSRRSRISISSRRCTG